MKKKLLPIFLISLFGMVAVGCGNSEPQYTVTITNKEELKNNLLVDGYLKMELSITPAGNVASLIKSGEITITSSKTDIATVSGANIYGLKEGTTTLTVTYKTATDTVDAKVNVKTAKDLYGTVHAGTAADPLDNEDAILVANHKDYAKQDYYVKGVVDRFYAAPESRTDGKVSYYLKPATEGGAQFEVYNCLKEDGTGLTDDEIWVNGTAVAHGVFTLYGTQAETDGAVFVSCEGNKPAPKQTIEKTLAEVIALGKELEDGDSTYDLYKFDGYVVKKDGNNYFLASAKSPVPTDLKEMFELYGAGDHADKLLEGAKVNVTCQVKNYHGQIENSGKMTIEVVEAGQAWPIVYKEVSVAKALEACAKLEDNKTSTDYYAVTGVVVALDGEYSTQYKTMSFTMADAATDEAVLTVFRTKLAEGVDPASIVAGVEVIVKGQLQKYVKNDTTTLELVAGTTELKPTAPAGQEEVAVDVAGTSFTADPSDANIATFTSGVVTLTLDKNESTTANRLSDSAHLRIYKSAKFTIAITGGSISTVAVSFDGSYSSALAASTFTNASYGEGDVLTATEGATSISFVASAQIRISRLVILYTPAV